MVIPSLPGKLDARLGRHGVRVRQHTQETVYSMIATRFVKNSVFQRNVQVAEELREKGSRCGQDDRIAHIIYTFFKRNDVQSRSIGPSDLLKIELRSDSLKLFDQAWGGNGDGNGKRT